MLGLQRQRRCLRHNSQKIWMLVEDESLNHGSTNHKLSLNSWLLLFQNFQETLRRPKGQSKRGQTAVDVDASGAGRDGVAWHISYVISETVTCFTFGFIRHRFRPSGGQSVSSRNTTTLTLREQTFFDKLQIPFRHNPFLECYRV